MSDDSRNGTPRAFSGGSSHRKSKPRATQPTCSPSPPEVSLGHTFMYRLFHWCFRLWCHRYHAFDDAFEEGEQCDVLLMVCVILRHHLGDFVSFP